MKMTHAGPLAVWASLSASFLAATSALAAPATGARATARAAPIASPSAAPAPPQAELRPQAAVHSGSEDGGSTAVARAAGTPSSGLWLSLGGHLYFDSGTLSNHVARNIELTNTEAAFSNDSSLALSVDLLKQLGKNFRFGGGLRYFFYYDYKLDDNPNPDTPLPAVRLGQLLEILGRADLLVPITDAIGAFFGVHGGPVILFPSGDLQTEINANRAQGIHVWDSPRLGYAAGVHFGARYRVHERVFIRPEVDLSWEHIFLFDTTQQVPGFTYERKESASMRRTLLGAAIEIAL